MVCWRNVQLHRSASYSARFHLLAINSAVLSYKLKILLLGLACASNKNCVKLFAFLCIRKRVSMAHKSFESLVYSIKYTKYLSMLINCITRCNVRLTSKGSSSEKWNCEARLRCLSIAERHKKRGIKWNLTSKQLLITFSEALGHKYEDFSNKR